jgi:hypothetical protein
MGMDPTPLILCIMVPMMILFVLGTMYQIAEAMIKLLAKILDVH